MKRFSSLLLLLSICFSLNAQNPQTSFEEAKALFDSEQYALALVKFAPITSLTGNSDLVSYASYYYAISAYKSGDTEAARNMFLQIRQKFAGWKQMDEVHFWLAQLSFEKNDPRAAMTHLSDVKSDIRPEEMQAMKDFHFRQITDLETLQDLLRLYPEESVIASQLANAITKLPVNEQDLDLLNRLSRDYDVSVDLSIDGIEVSPKKSVYNVALFLPFEYQDDSVGFERATGTWTARFLEGVKIGVAKLKEEGISVNLLTFDTRRSANVTSGYLSDPSLQDLDLIIGPVFQGPVRVVSEFSRMNKINMINPLSSNGQIILDNPYAFLYYPSHESVAIKSAAYAKENFTENKNAAVFYSGFADKARADLYKNLIEQDSFNVVIFKSINRNKSSDLQNILMEEEEVLIDSVEIETMIAEMDSLREAGERDWEIYEEQDFYLDSLKIRPDSIGHIFIASDFASLSASAISAIDARPDTIHYLSSTRWLSSEQSISFEQLESIGAAFTGVNLIEYDREAVADFRRRYQEAYSAYPRKEERFGDSYLGYDVLVFYGRLLGDYGKYFQVGLKRAKEVNGELTTAFDYRLSNDNRYIPIYKVINSQLVKIQD